MKKLFLGVTISATLLCASAPSSNSYSQEREHLLREIILHSTTVPEKFDSFFDKKATSVDQALIKCIQRTKESLRGRSRPVLERCNVLVYNDPPLLSQWLLCVEDGYVLSLLYLESAALLNKIESGTPWLSTTFGKALAERKREYDMYSVGSWERLIPSYVDWFMEYIGECR